jgi:Protein of unknown function (DUF1640)
MSTLARDTHSFIKQLQSKQIPEEQAEAIVQVIVAMHEANASSFVPKHELTHFKSDLSHDFDALEKKLSHDIDALEKKVSHDLDALENKLLHKIKDEIAPVRTNIAVLMWMSALIVAAVIIPTLKDILK